MVIATSCAILGPNDFQPSRMGQLLLDFANGRLRAYIPGGFEFVAARDIAEGHRLAMEKGRTGQKYIFSTEFKTVDELMEIYEAVTGRRRPRLRLPRRVMLGSPTSVRFGVLRVAPDAPQRFTPGAVRILRMHRRAEHRQGADRARLPADSIRRAIEEQYAFFVRPGLDPAAAARLA